MKVTPAGIYYLENLAYEFIYLDCILADTPISEEMVLGRLRSLIHSTDLKQRLDRTNSFLDYLSNSEKDEYQNHPEYLHSEFTNQYFTEGIVSRFNELEKEIVSTVFPNK